jgi:hypothetical protein
MADYELNERVCSFTRGIVGMVAHLQTGKLKLGRLGFF